MCRCRNAGRAQPSSAYARQGIVARETCGCELRRFRLGEPQYAERFVREDAEQKLSVPVEDRIFEPLLLPGIVLKDTIGERFLQGTDRGVIERPTLSSAPQIIGSSTAHPLANRRAERVRAHKLIELLPSIAAVCGRAGEKVDGELVGANASAPFNEPPALGDRVIAGNEIAFNQR